MPNASITREWLVSQINYYNNRPIGAGQVYYIVSHSWWARICAKAEVDPATLLSPPVAFPNLDCGSLRSGGEFDLNEGRGDQIHPCLSPGTLDFCEGMRPWIQGSYTSVLEEGIHSTPIVVLRKEAVLGKNIVALPSELYIDIQSSKSRSECSIEGNSNDQFYLITRVVRAWGLNRTLRLDLHPRLVVLAIPKYCMSSTKKISCEIDSLSNDFLKSKATVPQALSCNGNLCFHEQLLNDKSQIHILGAALLSDAEPLVAQLKAATLARMSLLECGSFEDILNNACRVWTLNRDHVHIVAPDTSSIHLSGFELVSRTHLSLPLVSLSNRLQIDMTHAKNTEANPNSFTIVSNNVDLFNHAPVFLLEPLIQQFKELQLFKHESRRFMPTKEQLAKVAKQDIIKELPWCFCTLCREDPWRTFLPGDQVDAQFSSSEKWEHSYVVEILPESGDDKITQNPSSNMIDQKHEIQRNGLIRVAAYGRPQSEVFETHSTRLAPSGSFSRSSLQPTEDESWESCNNYWSEDFCSGLVSSDNIRGLLRNPGPVEKYVTQHLYTSSMSQELREFKDFAIISKDDASGDSNVDELLGVFQMKSVIGRVGFRNLGNTCYLNSTLQCLLQIPSFVEPYASGIALLGASSFDRPFARGQMAHAFTEIVREAWFGDTTALQYSAEYVRSLVRLEVCCVLSMATSIGKYSFEYALKGFLIDTKGNNKRPGSLRVIAPWQLRVEIARQCPAFDCMEQQDASELLSLLLDGLHEDFNESTHDSSLRCTSSLDTYCSDNAYEGESINFDYNRLSVNTSELALNKDTTVIQYGKDMRQGDDISASVVNITGYNQEPNIAMDQNKGVDAWNDHMSRNSSMLVRLCHGMLKSSVRCTDCSSCQTRFDPFTLLSLPIPNDSQSQAQNRLLDGVLLSPLLGLGGALALRFCISTESNLQQLKKAVVKSLEKNLPGVAENDLVCGVLSGRALATLIHTCFGDYCNHPQMTPSAFLEEKVLVSSCISDGEVLIIWHCPKANSRLQYELNNSLPYSDDMAHNQHISLIVRHYQAQQPKAFPTFAQISLNLPAKSDQFLLPEQEPTRVVSVGQIRKAISEGIVSILDIESCSDLCKSLGFISENQVTEPDELMGLLEKAIPYVTRVFLTNPGGTAVLFELPTWNRKADIQSSVTEANEESMLIDLQKLSDLCNESPGQRIELAIAVAWFSNDEAEHALLSNEDKFNLLKGSARGIGRCVFEIASYIQKKLLCSKESVSIPERSIDSERPVRYLLDCPQYVCKKVLNADAEGSSNLSAISLADCLDTFSEVEILQAPQSAWVCPECLIVRHATKRLQIWSSPRLLIIQLKRFVFTSQSRKKISSKVMFPRRLDISAFVSNDKDRLDTVYELCGVTNHSGSLQFGHYTSTVQLHETSSPSRIIEMNGEAQIADADDFVMQSVGTSDGWSLKHMERIWLYSSDDEVAEIPSEKVQDAVVNEGSYILYYNKVGNSS